MTSLWCLVRTYTNGRDDKRQSLRPGSTDCRDLRVTRYTTCVLRTPDDESPIAVDAAPTAVSVDGGRKFGQLAQLSVVGKDGATRPARADDVTNLRWVVPSLAGGASGKVAFRAKVK